MKIFKRYFALLIVVFGMSAQCSAGQDLPIIYDNSQACGNYYVQPGSVYVAPNGIFILFDEEFIQVNVLCVDEKGVYVPGSEMSRQFVWCPHCGGWYDPDHPERHKCPGPR